MGIIKSQIWFLFHTLILLCNPRPLVPPNAPWLKRFFFKQSIGEWQHWPHLVPAGRGHTPNSWLLLQYQVIWLTSAFQTSISSSQAFFSSGIRWRKIIKKEKECLEESWNPPGFGKQDLHPRCYCWFKGNVSPGASCTRCGRTSAALYEDD